MSKNNYEKVAVVPDIENFTVNSYQLNGAKTVSFDAGLPSTEPKPSKYSVKYIKTNILSRFNPQSVKIVDNSIVPRKNLRFWSLLLIILSLHSLWCDYWDVNEFYGTFALPLAVADVYRLAISGWIWRAQYFFIGCPPSVKLHSPFEYVGFMSTIIKMMTATEFIREEAQESLRTDTEHFLFVFKYILIGGFYCKIWTACYKHAHILRAVLETKR